MRTFAIALLLVLGGGLAWVASVALPWSEAMRVANYRRKEVPVVLGIALALAVFAATLIVFSLVLLTTRSLPVLIGRQPVVTVIGCLIVFLGGLYDDRASGPARGLVGHFRELFRGNVTPGIVKLVAAVAAAALVAWAYRPSLAAALVGIPVMAGAADLWNLLDVRPGRALKLFIPVCLVLFVVSFDRQYPFVAAAALGASAVVLPLDLGERGMLGDSGANFLGFVVGVGLFQALPLWGLVLALGAILALHWASETVTLSTIIDRVHPLYWYDRLGRMRDEAPEDARSEESGRPE